MHTPVVAFTARVHAFTARTTPTELHAFTARLHAFTARTTQSLYFGDYMRSRILHAFTAPLHRLRAILYLGGARRAIAGPPTRPLMAGWLAGPLAIPSVRATSSASFVVVPPRDQVSHWLVHCLLTCAMLHTTHCVLITHTFVVVPSRDQEEQLEIGRAAREIQHTMSGMWRGLPATGY